MKLRSLVTRNQKTPYHLFLKYSLIVAELDSLFKSKVKLLGKPRNALGRYVATSKIRCGLCALVYCIRHGNTVAEGVRYEWRKLQK